MSAEKLILSLLLLCVWLLPTASASAKCASTHTTRNTYAPIPFGHISLQNKTLQPAGSPLSSVLVPPTHYTGAGANADTILWTCDLSDEGQLYFLVATNGTGESDDIVPISSAKMAHVYPTVFAEVGLHQMMDEVHVTHNWTPVPLKSRQRDPERGLVYIRVRDLPSLHAQLYRVEPVSTGTNTNNCGGNVEISPGNPNGTKRTNYTCPDPSSYIQLAGPGLIHDTPGADSNQYDQQQAPRAGNGFGYRLHQAMSLSRTPSCVVTSATPQVQFLPVNVQEMEAGGKPEVHFSVDFACSNSPGSQIYLALQASPGAFAAAQRLGMAEIGGGTRYLLSDQYGRDGIAKGVGIALYKKGGSIPRYFANPANSVAGGIPTGQNSGWYPLTQDTKPIPGAGGQHSRRLELKAVLERLQGQSVTPGKIHATAYVQVKIP